MSGRSTGISSEVADLVQGEQHGWVQARTRRPGSHPPGGFHEVFDERRDQRRRRAGTGTGTRCQQVQGAGLPQERLRISILALTGADRIEYARIGESGQGEGDALPEFECLRGTAVLVGVEGHGAMGADLVGEVREIFAVDSLQNLPGLEKLPKRAGHRGAGFKRTGYTRDGIKELHYRGSVRIRFEGKRVEITAANDGETTNLVNLMADGDYDGRIDLRALV